MIRKTEKYYFKKVGYYGKQKRKSTTYWLLWILPIFTKDEILGGDYET
ncbi:hypothetical protein [Halalkalibacter oceani]